jgi:hypothetical protein
MSKQTGIIKLDGAIGGIAFYQSQGQHLARTANGPSKERIANDAAFVRTRENNKEFGGSATAAKALRIAMASSLTTMADSRLVSRLTKNFKEICNKDVTSPRGQRSILLSTNKPALTNLNFNAAISFSSVFTAPYTLSNVAARNVATAAIPVFLPASYINAPAGATHFAIIHALGVVSDYTYNASTQSYAPTQPTLNTIGAVTASASQSLSVVLPAALSLVTTLPGAPVLTTDASVVECLGIQFYQRVGTVDYPLAQGNAMQIIKIF